MNKKPQVLGRTRACLEFLKEINPKNKTLIDVGSSYGWLEKEVGEWGYKKIIGIDPSNRAIARAKKLAPKAEFHQGEAGKIPLKDSTGDIAIIFDVIEHVPANSEKEVFKEINRVLKKDGVLLLTTPNDHPLVRFLDPAWYLGHRHYTTEKIAKMLRSTGYKVVSKEVKGDIWQTFYMLWFYFAKWVLKKEGLSVKWFDDIYDRGYSKNGIATVFVKAQKI